MGIFGRNDDFQQVKEEYRAVKAQIANEEADLRTHRISSLPPNVAAFDYIVEEDIEEDRLSDLGACGWELVNFASYTVGWGVNGNSAMKVHMRYVFKRPSVTSPFAQERIETLTALRQRKAELVNEIELRGYIAE